jgi:hypothetical protein
MAPPRATGEAESRRPAEAAKGSRVRAELRALRKNRIVHAPLAGVGSQPTLLGGYDGTYYLTDNPICHRLPGMDARLAGHARAAGISTRPLPAHH